jgi:hypothetical protein
LRNSGKAYIFHRMVSQTTALTAFLGSLPLLAGLLLRLART